MQNFFHRTNPIQDYLIYHKPAPKRPIIIILNTYHSSSNEDLACHDDSYYFQKLDKVFASAFNNCRHAQPVF